LLIAPSLLRGRADHCLRGSHWKQPAVIDRRYRAGWAQTGGFWENDRVGWRRPAPSRLSLKTTGGHRPPLQGWLAQTIAFEALSVAPIYDRRLLGKQPAVIDRRYRAGWRRPLPSRLSLKTTGGHRPPLQGWAQTVAFW